MSAIRKLAASRLFVFLLALLLVESQAYATTILTSVPFTFVNGTPSDATQVNANFNQIIAQTNAGAAGSGSNNDITALNALLTPLTQGQGGNVVYLGGTSAGSVNAQTVTVTTPTGWTLVPGKMVIFPPGLTNTGATTLAVNAGAATAVETAGATGLVALTGGELTSGVATIAEYDGTEFVLINPDIFASANVWGGGQTFNGTGTVSNGATVVKQQALTVTGGNAAWDMSRGPNASVALTGATALTNPTNQTVGAQGVLTTVEDATGGRTLSFGTSYVLADGSAPIINLAALSRTTYDYTVVATPGVGSIVLTPHGTRLGPHVILEDQKSSGTAGQTLSAGQNQRVLNTTVYNYGNLASLSSNRFTLPAGTYDISFWSILHGNGAPSVGQATVYNFTDSTYAVNGSTARAGIYYNTTGSNDVQMSSQGANVVTITGAKAFEVRMFSNGGDGGVAASSGNTEVYTHVEITKLF